jgi:heat shock protein HspQ
MNQTAAKFGVGQLVIHKLFNYRGVVADIDPFFKGTEQWYQGMARSKPTRDQPWHHVLVDDHNINTYVAKKN